MDDAAGDSRRKQLPEVPLRWTDFMWSMEKLRHKPYSKKTRERDWFRINPLEMVLLGCQSVISNAMATRDNVTMAITMGPLSEDMLRRPRYWTRMVSILVSTIQHEDVPATVLQRCCSTLVSLWRRLEDIPEFQPSICGWSVAEVNVIEATENTLCKSRRSLGAPHSCELEQWSRELEKLKILAPEFCHRLLSQHAYDVPVPEATSSNQEVGLRDILMIPLKQCSSGGNLQLQIQVYLMFKSVTAPEFKINLGSVTQLISVIRESLGDSVGMAALYQLLAILQLLAVRWKEIESPVEESSATPVVRSDSHRSSSNSDLKQEGEEEDDKEQGGEKEEEREAEGEEMSGEEPPPPSLPPHQQLMDALTTALKKWREVCEANKKADHPSVAPKLLSLVHTILSFNPLHHSLPVAVRFLDQPLSMLMAYSTEGYLSDSPGEFLVQLFEFITSLVEQGSSLDEALQTNLPNLFGPAFGIRNHAVSCKLLEYGYLSVCSQHKKLLLTKSLRFVMEVFHLFSPVDQVAAEARACALHVEALSASHCILEQLLYQVVPGEGRSSTRGVAHDSIDLEEEGENRQLQSLEPEPDTIPKSDLEPNSVLNLEQEQDYAPVVTDDMRESDKQLRLKVLLKLLELSCVMIRSGDDITFVFASILPKLFRAPSPGNMVKFNKQKLQKFFGEEPPPPPSQITWKVDKKELAVQLLDLAVLFVENDSASPFQLCGIVIPKLVKNLDRMNLFDEEKMSLTLEVLRVTRETLEAGHDVDDLISHGIDLIAILLPETATCEELRVFISQIATHLVTFNLSSMLFLIKNACQFMKNSFPGEVADVQELFKALLFRGKRDEIRGVFRVCKEPIKQDQFIDIHRYLYGYATGKLSHKQLIALCEILVHAMDIEKPQKAVREIVTNVEEEEESVVEERVKLERAVMTRLVSPCLDKVESSLKEKKFKREVWEVVQVQLAQIALFRTLFQSEFASFSNLSNEQLLVIFKGKFPPDVLSSDDAMNLLSVSASRIEHMQVPRYDSLRTMLSGLLRHFLTLDDSVADDKNGDGGDGDGGAGDGGAGDGGAGDGGAGDGGANKSDNSGEESEVKPSSLQLRMDKLQRDIEQLPRNVEDKGKLVAHGYSGKLWEEKLCLSVKTDGSLSLEENMRQNLLACYVELADILKQMAVTHVSVDGEMIKCVELFTDDLSLTDLKGRRAVAIRAIDQKRGGMANEGHFYERKIALLAKEDQIEADFEKMSKAAIKPKLFQVVLNTNFFDCARCCGTQIIGCYAPTGEHCERPLEIGLRCDSGIASIYDEAGVEIENAELLFTEEGAYLFKAYSNGHPYDTSQVWVALFTALLKEAPSPLLPAVIIPGGYPNQRTWEAVRRCVPTELTGSMLSCRLDFSPEWRTYYDHRPDRVRMGVDIVLHPGFSLTSDPSRPVYQRQRSKFTKDLAGLIFEEAMQNLLEDEWLKQFKFLGKVISRYISVCVSEGIRKVSIISEGFDYDRWKKIALRNKQLPSNLSSTQLPQKTAVVEQIVNFLDGSIVRWCESTDLLSLCSSSHKQLLELKGFLERSKDFREKGVLKDKLKSVRELLAQCMFSVSLLSLPESLQEEIIHWVFRNEDRVWRYRGGRDGHETLQQFMNFLGREKMTEHGGSEKEQEGECDDVGSTSVVKPSPNPYAGVVVFCVPMVAEFGRDVVDINSFQVDQMVAYAVGEMMKQANEEDDQMSPVTARELAGAGEDKMEEEERGGGGIVKNESHLQVTRTQNQFGSGMKGLSNQVSCYEVVTAWVHPSYRGLSLSTQMYLLIVRQVPSRLVVCDMVVGSVERIINSSWLLQLLERLRVLSLVVQKRQLSYNVTTQSDGGAEQFEQVVFNVRPMRFSLRVYDTLQWFKDHPKLTTAAALLIPVATATAGVVVAFRVVR